MHIKTNHALPELGRNRHRRRQLVLQPQDGVADSNLCGGDRIRNKEIHELPNGQQQPRKPPYIIHSLV